MIKRGALNEWLGVDESEREARCRKNIEGKSQSPSLTTKGSLSNPRSGLVCTSYEDKDFEDDENQVGSGCQARCLAQKPGLESRCRVRLMEVFHQTPTQ